jgi:hypothetical protein
LSQLSPDLIKGEPLNKDILKEQKEKANVAKRPA